MTRCSNEKGQSTVEFALSMILVVAFGFFFFQLSMLLAFGNFAHYATFMAARAYLASGPTSEDQIDRARRVITQNLKISESASGRDRFPFIAKGFGDGNPRGLQFDDSRFNPSTAALSWMQGVRYKFKGRVFIIPLSGVVGRGAPLIGAAADSGNLTLTAEAFLGREPAEDKCRRVMGRLPFDNGC